MRKNTSASNLVSDDKPEETTQSYVVEDLSVFEAQEEVVEKGEVVFEATTKKLLSEQGRQIIEDLLFVGKTSKTVEIAGHKFELSTLTHREHNLLMKELAKINETADIFNIRIYTLSSAIRSIDGVKFDEVIDSTSGIFEGKLNFLDNLQLKVIEQLFMEYSKLVEETDKIVTGESIKKS